MRKIMQLVTAVPTLLVAFTTSVFTPLAAAAVTCQVNSPAQTVALVELYTSEGCSSCPPADRWLSELPQRFTAEQLVPLALHVDYWDDLGWPDPFAQAQFSARQQRLSQLSKASTVYTPEVFVGMKEARQWSKNDDFAAQVAAINRQPARASIELTAQVDTSATTRIEAQFVLPKTSTSSRPAARGFVIVFENNLSTEVPAGENRGARLDHSQVVRYWSPPIELDALRGETNWQQKIVIPDGWKRQNLGIAAFVETPDRGEILQAVMLPGCV